MIIHKLVTYCIKFEHLWNNFAISSQKLFQILLSLKNNDIKFFYAYSFNLTRKYLPSFAILPPYPFCLGHKTRMELEITMV